MCSPSAGRLKFKLPVFVRGKKSFDEQDASIEPAQVDPIIDLVLENKFDEAVLHFQQSVRVDRDKTGGFETSGRMYTQARPGNHRAARLKRVDSDRASELLAMVDDEAQRGGVVDGVASNAPQHSRTHEANFVGSVNSLEAHSESHTSAKETAGALGLAADVDADRASQRRQARSKSRLKAAHASSAPHVPRCPAALQTAQGSAPLEPGPRAVSYPPGKPKAQPQTRHLPEARHMPNGSGWGTGRLGLSPDAVAASFSLATSAKTSKHTHKHSRPGVGSRSGPTAANGNSSNGKKRRSTGKAVQGYPKASVQFQHQPLDEWLEQPVGSRGRGKAGRKRGAEGTGYSRAGIMGTSGEQSNKRGYLLPRKYSMRAQSHRHERSNRHGLARPELGARGDQLSLLQTAGDTFAPLGSGGLDGGLDDSLPLEEEKYDGDNAVGVLDLFEEEPVEQEGHGDEGAAGEGPAGSGRARNRKVGGAIARHGEAGARAGAGSGAGASSRRAGPAVLARREVNVESLPRVGGKRPRGRGGERQRGSGKRRALEGT